MAEICSTISFFITTNISTTYHTLEIARFSLMTISISAINSSESSGDSLVLHYSPPNVKTCTFSSAGCFSVCWTRPPVCISLGAVHSWCFLFLWSTNQNNRTSTIYCSVVHPAFLYDSECWLTFKNNELCFTAMETKTPYSRTGDIHDQYRVAPIIKKLWERCARWIH